MDKNNKWLKVLLVVLVIAIIGFASYKYIEEKNKPILIANEQKNENTESEAKEDPLEIVKIVTNMENHDEEMKESYLFVVDKQLDTKSKEENLEDIKSLVEAEEKRLKEKYPDEKLENIQVFMYKSKESLFEQENSPEGIFNTESHKENNNKMVDATYYNDGEDDILFLIESYMYLQSDIKEDELMSYDQEENTIYVESLKDKENIYTLARSIANDNQLLTIKEVDSDNEMHYDSNLEILFSSSLYIDNNEEMLQI